MTEEVRSAVEARGKTTDLQASVERIAAAEMVPKAQIYRKAVREFVARYESRSTVVPESSSSTPPTPRRPGVFP